MNAKVARWHVHRSAIICPLDTDVGAILASRRSTGDAFAGISMNVSQHNSIINVFVNTRLGFTSYLVKDNSMVSIVRDD